MGTTNTLQMLPQGQDLTIHLEKHRWKFENGTVKRMGEISNLYIAKNYLDQLNTFINYSNNVKNLFGNFIKTYWTTELDVLEEDFFENNIGDYNLPFYIVDAVGAPFGGNTGFGVIKNAAIWIAMNFSNDTITDSLSVPNLMKVYMRLFVRICG